MATKTSNLNRKPFKSPLKRSAEENQSTSPAFKKNRIVVYGNAGKTTQSTQCTSNEGDTTHAVRNLDLLSNDELLLEKQRIETMISQKRKEIEEIKTKRIGQISKAGDSDGRVEMLTKKWKSACIEAIYKLHEHARIQNRDATILSLFDFFKIDTDIQALLGYSTEMDCFNE